MFKSLFIVIRIFLGILVYFMFIHDDAGELWKAFNRRNWMEVNGSITDVILTEKKYMVGKKYVSIFLKYSYRIKQREYEEMEILVRDKIYSTNYSLDELTETEKKNHPKGTVIKVRVNPENNAMSTSLEDSGRYFYALLIGFGAEAWLLISIVKSLKKDKSTNVKTPL